METTSLPWVPAPVRVIGLTLPSLIALALAVAGVSALTPRAKAPPPPSIARHRAPLRLVQLPLASHGVRRVARADFDALLRLSAGATHCITTVERDDPPIGIGLMRIAPRSRIARLGLQDGDRLVRLSGVGISCPSDILRAYAPTRASPSASLEVVRGSARHYFPYRLTGGTEAPHR
jgi:hypothetical protein